MTYYILQYLIVSYLSNENLDSNLNYVIEPHTAELTYFLQIQLKHYSP